MASTFEFIDLKAQYVAQRQEIDRRIQTVLDHARFIMGPEVAELETRLADYVGTDACITVSSGTEALLISLMALGIGPGDEVITSPFTFVASVEVIVLVGATPVLVDVEPDTANIDASRIEAAITPRTRAIMPVSLYGQPADMDEIGAIAAKYGLTVIEDAAQSFGAEYREKKSCSLSKIGCTSFFPSKPLACYGDGGAIFTDDAGLAQAMREIRVHGQKKRYYHSRVGVGGRMDTIQAAIVLAKLESFDWEVERRKAIGRRYLDLLAANNGIELPVLRPQRTSVWAQFTIQVEDRQTVVDRLRDQGIPTAIHYPIPVHRQPAYHDICSVPGGLEHAELLSQRVLSLPMHPYLDEAQQDRVVGALRS